LAPRRAHDDIVITHPIVARFLEDFRIERQPSGTQGAGKQDSAADFAGNAAR
jgi:hypothetical protein